MVSSNVRQTSSIYGFYARDFNLVAGKEYVLTVNGCVSQETANEGGTLTAYIFNDSWNDNAILQITSQSDETAYITFTPRYTGKYNFRAYSYKSHSVVSKAVTVNWAVLTEGNVPAAEWIPSEAESTERKLMNMGIDVNDDGSIDMQADKFRLRNLDGDVVMTANEYGDLEVKGVIKADMMYRLFNEEILNVGTTNYYASFMGSVLQLRTGAYFDTGFQNNFLLTNFTQYILPHPSTCVGRELEIFGCEYHGEQDGYTRMIVLAVASTSGGIDDRAFYNPRVGNVFSYIGLWDYNHQGVPYVRLIAHETSFGSEWAVLKMEYVSIKSNI
jgi:hypothetical protein